MKIIRVFNPTGLMRIWGRNAGNMVFGFFLEVYTNIPEIEKLAKSEEVNVEELFKCATEQEVLT